MDDETAIDIAHQLYKIRCIMQEFLELVKEEISENKD